MPDESRREENAESREKWRKQKLLDQEIRRQMEQRTRRHMKWLAENRLLPGRQLAELEDQLNSHWAGTGKGGEGPP